MLNRTLGVLHQLVVHATPIRLVATVLVVLPTALNAQAIQAPTVPSNVTFTTTQAEPIVVPVASAPNFDIEVMQPLKTAQAEAAAQAQAKIDAARAAATKARATTEATQAAPSPAGDDALTQLRYCEAGGIYTRNSGNGYFGAYQYSASTWNNYGGYSRPDLAPGEVQDAKAKADIARRGYGAWPACSQKLGLK